MKKGFLMRHFLKIVVLDEVDELYSRGYKQHIQDTFKYLPYDAQLAVFSSTIPKEFLKLHGHLLRNPAKIL
jgi:superfamily II DNA/RNA helicase